MSWAVRLKKLSSPIDVAVGVITNSDNQVLVAKRVKNKKQADLWEFPGGKVEVGEPVYQALCRELKEEVGIDVLAAESLFNLAHDYDGYSVVLHIYKVTSFQGEVHGLEGQPIQWISYAALKTLPVPEANLEIITRLALLA